VHGVCTASARYRSGILSVCNGVAGMSETARVKISGSGRSANSDLISKYVNVISLIELSIRGILYPVMLCQLIH